MIDCKNDQHNNIYLLSIDSFLLANQVIKLSPVISGANLQHGLTDNSRNIGPIEK